MSTDLLIYQTSPAVIIATNTFIRVPIILRYEGVNLIEIVEEVGLGFTTQIPIYHSDGTQLASVKGVSMYTTKAGDKAGLKMDKLPHGRACRMGTQTLFEIRNQPGDSFKIEAELYTPDAQFVKCTESSTRLFDPFGQAIKLKGGDISGCTFRDCMVGISVGRDGSIDMP